jgi:hypothetical protein
MAVSSVGPPGYAPQESLLSLSQKKNGIGHGSVISDINTQNNNASPTSAPTPVGKVGSKVDKTV